MATPAFSFSGSGSNQLSPTKEQKELLQETVLKAAHVDWDPTGSRKNRETPTPQCLNRIKQDLSRFNKDKPPGIYVVHEEENIMIVHALIIGLKDTPYEGGFFHFFIKFPSNYPISPPRVKLMTTGGGHVRFNPNIYQSGKVCLSILGTWMGPPWSPALTLMGVLVSIQSLLNDKPYHNEPGYEVERKSGDVESYNNIIQHECLRVAVCGMVDNETGIFIPDTFMQIMEAHFMQSYARYIELVDARLHLEGQNAQNPFRHKARGTFQYKAIRLHLERIHERLTSQRLNLNGKTDNENDVKLINKMPTCSLKDKNDLT